MIKELLQWFFGRSEPDYYLDGENEIYGYEKETFELLKLIIEKFKNQEFRSAKIKYNPNEYFEIEDYKENIKNWNIPSEMLTTTKGIKPVYLGTLIKFLKNKYQKSQKRKKRRN